MGVFHLASVNLCDANLCCTMEITSLHQSKVNLVTIKRLRGRGGFTVLLPYNTWAGLIFPKKEAAAL